MPDDLPHRKSVGKLIGAMLSAFLILLILCALCVPMFFSTSVGKKVLIKMISNRTGMQIEIKELSLGWFGMQTAREVQLIKKEDQLRFFAQEIHSDAPLWKIVFAHDFGQLQIIAPDLQVSKPFLPMAQSRAKEMPKRVQRAGVGAVELGMVDFPFNGKIVVKEGKVGLNPPGLEPITFDQITASLDMASREEIAFALSCATSQQGQIAFKGSATHLDAPFPTLAIQSTINQLPVRGIDQLVSLIYPEVNGLIYGFLGPSINLGCNLNASSGNFDLRLNAISPQITAYVATQSLNGILSLKSPAQINFNLTPFFWEKVVKLYPASAQWALTSPAFFQTTVEHLSCPVPSHASDLLKATFEARLVAPPQISMTLSGKPISLNGLTIDLENSQQLNAHLKAQLESERNSSGIAIGCQLDEQWNGTVELNAQSLPVDLFGMPSLAPLVGNVVDLNAKVDLKTGGPQAVHLNWQSDFLKVPSVDFSLGKSLSLLSPAKFSYLLKPAMVTSLPLIKDVPVQGMLQDLKVDFQNIKTLMADLTLNANQVVLGGSLPLKLDGVQAELAMNTFNQIGLQVSSEIFKASFAGAYDLDTKTMTLTKPFALQGTLDPATYRALVPQGPALAKPAVLIVTIDRCDLVSLEFAKLKMKGQLVNGELVLGAKEKQVVLRNTTVPFLWDGAGNTATISLNSQLQTAAGEGGLMQGQFTLSQLASLSTLGIQGSLDLQNLSSTLLDTFSGKPLSPLTGPTFNSKFKLQSTPDRQTLSVKWTSPLLNIDTEFTADTTVLQLQGAGSQISWTLTPGGYLALDQILANQSAGLIPFEIKESSTFTIALSKLKLPLAANPKNQRLPSIDFDLAKLQLGATGRNSKLIFLDKSSHETIQLSNMNFGLNKTDQGPFAATFDSAVLTQGSNAAARSGSVSMNGKLEQRLNPQGKFDFSGLTGALQLKAQQFPSRALDIIARAKGRTDFPFTTIFGNLINATLNVQLDQFSGPFTLNVNTPLTRADINGAMHNGALMLKDAAHVQMKITPEISRLVLKEVNPLNLSYVYSQEPITLEVPATGFYFPLYPFNVSKIMAPGARIELGKIGCRNEGNVNITLGLLKSKQFDKTSDLMLWFAPIDLSIKQGNVNIERTEILLADTFDVCLWGNVDLADDMVDMVLGLTAQTLSKAFGIKNLPDSYVLRIPMRGKADDVQIDTGSATAKIGLLLAWQQASNAGAFGKGPAGAIVGGLLNKMATLPDADAKVPPPKHPFPWEVGKAKTSHMKKKQFKPNDKPLKQILKVIK